MITPVVYLDMDGVLSDFSSGAFKAHGRPNPYLDPKNLGEWNLDKIWGISATDFWAPINAAGEEFWTGLDVLPGAKDLVAMLAGEMYEYNGVVAVATSPSVHPGCVPGKRKWLAEHFPVIGKNVVYTSAKHLLAGHNRLLIDDSDANVSKFQAAGGYALTYPAVQNRCHRFKGVFTDYLFGYLTGVFEGYGRGGAHVNK